MDKGEFYMRDEIENEIDDTCSKLLQNMQSN